MNPEEISTLYHRWQCYIGSNLQSYLLSRAIDAEQESDIQTITSVIRELGYSTDLSVSKIFIAILEIILQNFSRCRNYTTFAENQVILTLQQNPQIEIVIKAVRLLSYVDIRREDVVNALKLVLDKFPKYWAAVVSACEAVGGEVLVTFSSQFSITSHLYIVIFSSPSPFFSPGKSAIRKEF
jgi:hypothetical protein